MNKADDGIEALMILGLIVLLPLIVAVNAVFLRAAVNLANKLLGAGSLSLPNNPIVESTSFDESHLDRLNPYAMTGKAAVGDSDGQLASPIREPSLGNSCGMIVASVFAAFTLQSPVEAVARLAKVAPLPLQILSTLVGLFAMAGIYSAMLPATYGRGALVAIIHLLLAAVVGAFFTVLIMVVNGAM
jgi:hypothetical protein